MENSELVFIAAPLMGHLVPEIEFARQLVSQNLQISISILIPKLPVPDHQITAFIQSLDGFNNRISIHELPSLDNALPPDCSKRSSLLLDPLSSLYRPIVKQFVEQRRQWIAGIVIDLFCVSIIDVAEELGFPSYIFFPSGVNWLSLLLQLELIEVDIPSAFGELPPESTPLKVAGYRNPVPLKVWPLMLLSKAASAHILRNVGRYRSTNGILVNSFTDLEPDLLLSLSENAQNPPVYAIGPVLDLDRRMRHDPILSWLDAHPPESVVFLCFGSIGSIEDDQIKQIAVGIERSGRRFLWSLRRLPSAGEDFNEALPAGFLERTAGVGKVIGWAPQKEVLAHAAVGAFVSHCGWNSVLESLWFGVPIVAWPMYAEQHLNAFLLVRELGIAVELTMEYLYDFGERKVNMVVMAEDVERGIRRMMEKKEGMEVRKKVKEMSRLAKKAMEIGGSSNESLGKFAKDVIKLQLRANECHRRN